MRTLIFEAHATSLDNEAGLASGHYDVDLSPRGEREAAAMGQRYPAGAIDLVVTSDLRRAWRTADLAFGRAVPMFRDARLREVDYGRLTRHPVREVEAVREAAVAQPFPGGESYQDAAARVRACLIDIAGRTEGTVLVIGHRATHYAIAHLLDGTPIEVQMRTPFLWQPGWRWDAPRILSRTPPVV